MERYSFEKDTQVKELPGNWLDLSNSQIEKVGSRNTPNGIYVIEQGCAARFKAIGKYAVYDGLILVGAPDGNLKIAPFTNTLEEQLKTSGYRSAAMRVPSLLSGSETFTDATMQRKLEDLAREH